MSATTQARPISETFAQAVANSISAAAGSDGAPALDAGDKAQQRPVSEFIPSAASAAAADAKYKSPEAEAIDKWVDDLAYYEETMEAMAKASLDQNFKDELTAIEQWFQVLSDPERTATLYSLLQYTNRVQQGFFIAFLQQLSRKDNRGASDRAKEAKKAADAGRQRRLSARPQLAIAGTNEKYAKMFGNEDDAPSTGGFTPTGPAGPMTAQPYRGAKISGVSAMFAARPKSAATSSGMFPPGMGDARPHSVLDPSNFDDPSIRNSMIEAGTAPPGIAGPPKGAKWAPMTPTFSSFSDIARGIERPQSTNDLERPYANARLSGLGSKLAAMRSPLGPGGADAGFLARQQGRSASSASGMMRGLHSPAFPPGLFPSNPWAQSPGIDKKTAASTAALKQKFANLIADSRDAKDAGNALHAQRLANGASPSGGLSANGEPKSPKPVEPIDFKGLNDIPGWFRSMRLHKYTPLFEALKWQEIIQLTDEQLTDKGVAALGARRKMLKVFEQVKIEAALKGISVEMPTA
jgi:hypothetical protein